MKRGFFVIHYPQWTQPQPLKFNPSTSSGGLLHTPVYTGFTSKLDDVVEQSNPFFGDSLQALFDTIKFLPPTDGDNIQDVPPPPLPPVTPGTENTAILNHLDDILSCWLGEVQRLEGTYVSDAILKKDIHALLLRMLQDGLSPEQDYNNLIFTGNLFIRLHDLIGMYNPVLHKREMIGLLVKLYDMHKLNEEVFTEICIKL